MREGDEVNPTRFSRLEVGETISPTTAEKKKQEKKAARSRRQTVTPQAHASHEPIKLAAIALQSACGLTGDQVSTLFRRLASAPPPVVQSAIAAAAPLVEVVAQLAAARSAATAVAPLDRQRLEPVTGPLTDAQWSALEAAWRK